MDDEKILELTGRIEETLGKENSAMISDTIGENLTGNTENRKAIAMRDEKNGMKNLSLLMALSFRRGKWCEGVTMIGRKMTNRHQRSI